MRIAIDMDEVLADTAGVLRALYRDRFGYTWSDADLLGHDPHDLAAPPHRAEVRLAMHQGHFFGDLPVMAGAVEAVAHLARRHEIWVATAAMEYPASFGAKYGWLRRHFPDLDPLRFVFCGDKSVLATDVLIDDSPRHFAHFQGIGVLFDGLHNRKAEVPHRVAGWAEVPAKIEEIAAGRLEAAV